MSEKQVNRRHVRLENFLQRQLHEEYSKVSWYEPCVVVNQNGKPAYCFVVVTDDHLYVVGNPPRQIQATVHLASINAIDVVNDFPDFLTGAERDQAQHIRVTFRANPENKDIQATEFTGEDEPTRSATTTCASSAAFRSISVLSEQASTCSDPGPDVTSEDAIGNKQRVNGLSRRRKFRRLLLNIPIKIRDKFQSRSGQNSPRVPTPNEEDESPGTNDASSDSGIGSDPPSGDNKTNLRVEDASTPCFLFRSPSPYQPNQLAQLDPDYYPSRPATSMTQRLNLNSPTVSETYSISSGYDRSPEPATPTSLISNDDVLAGLLQLPSLRVAPPPQCNFRSQTALGNYADHDRRKQRSNASLAAAFDDDGPPDLNGKTKVIVKELELHIYVLTPQCPVFRFLIYAWNNLLISSTMKLDSTQNIIKNNSEERYEQVLEELQRNLASSTDLEMANVRRSIESMSKDVQKSVAIKKMFWKNPTLFPAMVTKLRSLVSAPENSHEKQTIGSTMDKLKLSSLLLKLLDSLLQGSAEAHSARSHHLTYKNGRSTRELLLCLVAVPWVPLAYRDAILDIVTSHKRQSSHDWELFQEAPLIRSVLELTNNSSSALYNIMQITYQGREMNTKQQTFGLPWIVKVLTEVKQWEIFVSRLMSHVLSVSTPSSRAGNLTPSQSVQVHQQLTVLHVIITHSPLCDLHFRLNYADDVRYFILRKVISQKIPQNYPIRQNLLKVVDDLRKHVLGRQPITSNYATIHSSA